MNDKIFDARGMPCPKPLILVKEALTELQVGEEFSVLLDNEIAKENVLRYLHDHDANPECKDKNGAFTIRAKKNIQPQNAEIPRTAECGPKNNVLVIDHYGMGFGAEELGKILIEACINTIKEISPLPHTIVFYNGGVHLACDGSPVISSLSELESRGVRILVCGTCLNYHGLRDKLKVGIVSNMYEILNILSNTGNIVKI